jgi:hypothetical protein
VLVGALALAWRCRERNVERARAAAAAEAGKTDLDRHLAANAKRMQEACAAAASGARHVADREFDLRQGIRTGKLSAAEVRSAQGTLEATRRYAAKSQAECDAVRAEAVTLGAEAERAYRARQR